MKLRNLFVAALLFGLGLGAGSTLVNTADARHQDKKEDKGKDKKDEKDKKDDKGKDKPVSPHELKHLVDAAEHLFKAKESLKSAIKNEATQKKIEDNVIKELQQAMSDVDKSVNNIQQAIKKNRNN